MPHESISMTPEEVAAFAGTQGRAVLATLAPDGLPWAGAVLCAYRDGLLLFAVPQNGRSHANIQRDDRVCCILETNPSYYQIKGVMIHGHARRVTDAAVLDEVTKALNLHAGNGTSGACAPVVFQIDFNDVASFDFAKIKRKV